MFVYRSIISIGVATSYSDNVLLLVMFNSIYKYIMSKKQINFKDKVEDYNTEPNDIGHSYENGLRVDGSEISCGVDQLYGISSMENDTDIAYDLMCLYRRDDAEDLPAFLIFSDTEASGGVDRMATFIRKYKLGTVIRSREALNTNTNSNIRVGLWKINRNSMVTFLDKMFTLYKKQYKEHNND